MGWGPTVFYITRADFFLAGVIQHLAVLRGGGKHQVKIGTSDLSLPHEP